MAKISSKTVIGNMIKVMGVQIVSMLVSFIIGFIVPKFISPLTYSWWQVYVLYVGYNALFQFGIFDGFMLRYSAYDYSELDKKLVRSQARFLFSILDFLAVVIIMITFYTTKEYTFLSIVVIVVGIISKNLYRYTSFTFQMTNEIGNYSKAAIFQRLGYVLFIIALLIFGIDKFVYFCIADIFGDICGASIGWIKRKDLFLGKSSSVKDTWQEIFQNLRVGILVTIATFTSSFLVSGAKTIIQWRWDELTFGQISLSVSMMNVILVFVSAISVALLPSLKRMEESQLPKMYVQLRNIVSLILVSILLMYFPLIVVLDFWLPHYSDSLIYIGILLPSVVFSSKVNLLTNSYLKAYRKESVLLEINVFTMISGAIVFTIFAYGFNSINAVLYAVVWLNMINSFMAEVTVGKLIKIKLYRKFVDEITMTIVFSICVKLFSPAVGFGFYLGFVILYIIKNRKEYIFLLEKLKLIKKGAIG